jgi:hypothetical protein
MFVQTFALVLPCAFWRPDRGLRVALVWLLAATLPFVAGHEPRYYAPALLPFAIVAAAGFRSAGRLVFGERIPWGWALLLAVLVMVNRVVLAPLMPFEVRQSQLLSLMKRVHARNPGGTYLLPWASDYSLLRVSFPDWAIDLCLSRTPESRYVVSHSVAPMDPADEWWAGQDHYVGSLRELRRSSHPWLYLGWTYNPVALRLARLLSVVHLSRVGAQGRHDLHSHLAGSWVWYDSSLSRVPQDSLGQYRVYRLLQQQHHASATQSRHGSIAESKDVA